MEIRELSVPDAYSIHPRAFRDDRGEFLEWYRYEKLSEAIGHPLDLRQANRSVSKAGTVRGVHYADVPVGQAKYVSCVRGAVLDVIVDIRVGSPTFGAVTSVQLDDVDHTAVYLSEGLGHAFIALTEDATVVYLCSEVYNPTAERGINPLDPALELPVPAGLEPLLSEKDTSAPNLAEAAALGLLPDYQVCQDWYAKLRTTGAR